MKNAILLFALFFSLSLQAQKDIEIGVFFGGSNYSGDIPSGDNQISTRNMRPAAGLFGRYYVNKYVAFRAGLSVGSIRGNDAQSETLAKRNLSFRSRIFEAQALGELHLPLGNSLRSRSPFSPYLFGGVALFHFNPQTTYQGRWVDLQPLGTEGQGIDGNPSPYGRWQVSIPFGGGVRVGLGERWAVGLEVGLRRTFTDYLDDVSGNYPDQTILRQQNGDIAADLSFRGDELPGASSDAFPAAGSQRGSAEHDDWYGMGGLTISYLFSANKKKSNHKA